MTDDPVEQRQDDDEARQNSNEATERLMRLRVWLDGLLAGGPSLAEAVKPWREGLPIYNSAAVPFAELEKDVPGDNARREGEWLMAACRRIRQNREEAGEPLLDICEEEHKRRLTEVLDEIETGRFAGEIFTPMHVVLAARYIEGVIDSKNYRSRRQLI